jgi:hypothetical protein
MGGIIICSGCLNTGQKRVCVSERSATSHG